MQFITVIVTLFAAVSAIPTGTEASLNEARALGNEVAERSIASTVCNGACDVTCNSTVLALAQTECLKICKAKC
ncbi:uncharacterized protein LY89DRAFT_733894 [Mollisia scopiformis]|uniref:Uncharacterized protein n=1 Tax=Mollisia scopiformis TaxID=149040 RepID=A0A194X9Q1_MOLSC|nr:uncharacterized protein LY89DRAFT_733894 [Mollisia scopiformis]KUJ16893.1 hypothetical protein LY89DRAFT_733894 [Mollisia scopiformis]